MWQLVALWGRQCTGILERHMHFRPLVLDDSLVAWFSKEHPAAPMDVGAHLWAPAIQNLAPTA